MRQCITLFKIVIALCIWNTPAFTLAQKYHKIEKMYTHTDRPFYFPGESIWFKTYAVDETNIPSGISDVLVTELISPAGDVVQTQRHFLHLGAAYGAFQLKKEWVGGVYTLRSYSQYMRNQGEDSFFTKEITVQKVVVPQLLVKLDFDREAYGKGSAVRAIYTLEDLDNHVVANARLSVVLYIDGKEVTRKQLQTRTDGTQDIDFSLPEDLDTVDAVLVVQAEHNGVTESISRSVPILLDAVDLQFLPEGGKLLLGSPNQVAFKALDPFGRPADVRGMIVNQNGEEVVPFDSFHDGMGSVYFEPQVGQQYYAQLTHPFVSDSLSRYALPKTELMGAKLGMLKQEGDSLVLEVATTAKFKGKIVLIDAAQHLWDSREIVLKEGETTLHFDVKQLPQGIVKVQLQDHIGIVQSERLVFVNPQAGLQIALNFDQAQYLPRAPVNLEISTTDVHGNPVSSNLSVAVVDNALLTLADDKQDNIASYLLMSSELKGTIHEPSFYFDPEEPDRLEALDLVMLTHGWRTYLQKPVPRGKALKHNPERKDIVYGRITTVEDEAVQAVVLVLDRNGTKILQFKTDPEGHFKFKAGTVNYYVIAAYTEDRQQLSIHLDETLNEKYGTAGFNFNRNARATKETEVEAEAPEAPFTKPLQEKALDLSLNADNAALEEVVIVGYGIDRTATTTGVVQKVDSDDLAGVSGSVAQVLEGNVSGVQVTQAQGNGDSQITIRGAASIRGDSSPLFIIDGVPVNLGTGQDFDLSQLDASQIDAVSVVKGAAATALYGARGANGVIVITTKNQNYGNNKRLFSQKFKNYAVREMYQGQQEVQLNQPVHFYTPVYDSREVPEKRTDFRKTLYWNPVVQTDALGKASLRFYNSDALTSFKIIAEGIAAQGITGHKSQTYSVTKPLSITAKLPAYASVGDTLNIPVRITNATPTARKLSLALQFTEEFKVLLAQEIPKNIEVAANSYQVIDVRVTPVKTSLNAGFTARLEGASSADAFEERLEVVSPYFPIETSISNNQSAAYSFDIVNVIPGSLQADFALYIDVVGELMNGIEGIIRKPYGCFEQTSSATYPNVMVLQYLKATGKADPEVTAKALEYIAQGYKRLISFETKEGGFEWFGKTPPHQTLTAFGILEFTEMKEVYPEVSEAMLKRNIAWLLGQRDGKGGFHKSKKGYDSFASSPPLVANAYIVYALSEVGITTEIKTEYEAALAKALSSKEAYQMALMALAAHNFGDHTRYMQLMELLLEAYNKNAFEWNTNATITRSYGKAKFLETTAFFILAALREQVFDEVVAEGVQYIAQNREYGAFGNTQTTVMCLKALLKYNQLYTAKVLASEKLLTLNLNGTKLDLKQAAQHDGVLHIDSLERYIEPGTQRVHVTFADEKISFPYALNYSWKSSLPKSAEALPVQLRTQLLASKVRKGELARMEVEVRNTTQEGKGMITAIVGIPAGASVQAYQLKELMEENQIAYYEVVDNFVILYWRSFEAAAVKRIALDLKTDISGSYTAPASTVYPYYGDDFKFWTKGVHLEIYE